MYKGIIRLVTYKYVLKTLNDYSRNYIEQLLKVTSRESGP